MVQCFRISPAITITEETEARVAQLRIRFAL